MDSPQRLGFRTGGPVRSNIKTTNILKLMRNYLVLNSLFALRQVPKPLLYAFKQAVLDL